MRTPFKRRLFASALCFGAVLAGTTARATESATSPPPTARDTLRRSPAGEDTTGRRSISREELARIPVEAPLVSPTWPPPAAYGTPQNVHPLWSRDTKWVVEPVVHRGAVASVRHEIFRGSDGRSRDIALCTPAAVEARPDSNAALLIVFDGPQYIDEIPLPRLLDSLLATHAIPPCVAVLIDDGARADRLADLANHAAFSDLLAHELLPWVHARLACTHDPARVVLVGSSAGGVAAMHAALTHPDAFGNVLSQSGAFWRGDEGSNDAPYEWLASAWRSAPVRDVRFVLEVGDTESRGALGGAAPSILAANRRMRDVLRAKGYRVAYTEVAGGVHAPLTWRPRLAPALVALFALRGR